MNEFLVPADVRALIGEAGGRFFALRFVKENGEERAMTARLGVQKDIKGTGRPWRPETNETRAIVWCAKAACYRTVPLDRVTGIKVGKVILGVM